MVHHGWNTAHNWEIVGVVAGGLWAMLNFYAVATPYLSGPYFGALNILVGVFAIYICGLFLIGAPRDAKESMDEKGVYGHLD